MSNLPQIIIGSESGFHNRDLASSITRLEKSQIYKDLSTICIVPTRGQIHFRVVQSWMSLMAPMNQKFIRIFMSGMEVGAAYEEAIKMILADPNLSSWKYILTMEEDNMPPPDGLLKLYENMDEYDVIGGLYWTKGEGGMPMCYGNPKQVPLSFNPQLPKPEQITHCNGLGMGFTLFKLDIFKKMPAPWFQTVQKFEYGVGGQGFTQDLFFAHNASKHGIKFACDARVKVGHFDINNNIVW